MCLLTLVSRSGGPTHAAWGRIDLLVPADPARRVVEVGSFASSS